VAHPTIQDLRLVDLPMSMDGVRASRRDAPPSLGQHTDEILAELGFDPAAIGALRAQSIIG